MANPNSNALAWNYRWRCSETTLKLAAKQASCDQIPLWDWKDLPSLWSPKTMMADEIAVAKCQSCENIQSKMLRIQLAVSGSNSKQNAETLKTYTQQNADETPEHGTPAVALMQLYSSEAIRHCSWKMLCKLLCGRRQRLLKKSTSQCTPGKGMLCATEVLNCNHSRSPWGGGWCSRFGLRLCRWRSSRVGLRPSPNRCRCRHNLASTLSNPCADF